VMLLVVAPLASANTELNAVIEEAERLDQLETLMVAQDGEVIAERGYHGHRTSAPTNIKSASKTVISALVGIAIDRGVLEGPDQRIANLLEADLPASPDPRLRQVTVGHLLTMQAGLGSLRDATTAPGWRAAIGCEPRWHDRSRLNRAGR